MSLLSNSLLKLIKGANDNSVSSTRMAQVTSTDSSGTYLMFYGETVPSQKPYKKIDSVGNLSAGNTVILSNINGAYVIIGRV